MVRKLGAGHAPLLSVGTPSIKVGSIFTDAALSSGPSADGDGATLR